MPISGGRRQRLLWGTECGRKKYIKWMMALGTQAVVSGYMQPDVLTGRVKATLLFPVESLLSEVIIMSFIAEAISKSQIRVGCLNKTTKRFFAKVKSIKQSLTKKATRNLSKEVKMIVRLPWIIGIPTKNTGAMYVTNGVECTKTTQNLKWKW